MHVLLVGAELEENLATRYLAAALEDAGHTADLVAFASPDDTSRVAAALQRHPADLVGLSMTFQRRAHEFGALVQALRASGYRGHVTCGGHFPTFAFRELLQRYPGIDSVVRHEGEETLPELCRAVARGGSVDAYSQVAGLAFRLADGAVHTTEPRPLVQDLDALPLPKRVGTPPVHLGIPAAFLVGSRGCYGHCTFCCIHAFVAQAGGPRYRARSAENLAEEMAELRRSRGARMFVFHDDDFFTRDHERDLGRVTALRDALFARGVNDIGLVVKARPDDLDERVFAVLDQIGLLRVYVGIEAGCTQGLRTLGRGVDLDANRRGLAFLRERDVYACYNMLIFDPETTTASLRASLGFIRDNADVPMNFCRTEIYVGTPLMRRLQRQGRLVGDVFGWDYEISEPAAQRAFRVFSRAFRDRNFRCDGLMNSTLGLGYHLHLLRHFYPRAVTAGLRARTEAVIRRVNLDCVERMEEIVAFADAARATETHAFEDFANQTCEAVTRSNAALEADVAETTELIRQAARGTRARPPRLWVSVAAATLALSPLSCAKPPPPPPPDPLPGPGGYDDRDYCDRFPEDCGDDDGRFAQPPPGDDPDDVQVGDPPPPPHDVPPPPPPPPPDPLPPPQDPLPHPYPGDPPPPPHDPVPPPPPPDPLPPPHKR